MSSIWRVIKFSKPYHKYFLYLSVLILIGTIIDLSGTVLIKNVIDEIESELVDGNGDYTAALVFLVLMFALSMLATVIEAVSNRLGDYTQGRIGAFLTDKFYAKIFTISQSYFDSTLSGKIVNQLSRGIISLQDFLGALTNFIVPALVQTIFVLVLLWYYSPLIALLAFTAFPIYILLSHYSTKKWAEHQVKRNKIEDITRGRIQEVIYNIKLVKSFNMQQREYDFVSREMKKSVKIYDTQSTTYHFLNFLRNFGLELAIILVIVILFNQTFAGIMSIGEMVLIMQLLNRLRRPLFAMSFILERVKRAETGSKEYFEILDLKSAEQITSKAKQQKIKNPKIEFNNISFEYEDSEEVLSDINFKAQSPQTIALVGHSGAGKTTITNLLLKFYEPAKGSILLNGKDYKDLSHAEVRANISLVFQDSELFSSTIRENVSYGLPNATDKQIISALKKANAYEFVMKFKDKLDTKIGERGVKLSGGQKQRIQIARAILNDTPILILDEATSSLDAKSEKLVQAAVDNLMKDRLVLIIAHRFSTIQNADWVLVIDDGIIIDQGPSRKLAKKKGIYQELLNYQIEGNQKLLKKYDLSE